MENNNNNNTKPFPTKWKAKNGEQWIYKIAKGKEMKIRDLDKVKCIKDEEGKVLVVNGDIKER